MNFILLSFLIVLVYSIKAQSLANVTEMSRKKCWEAGKYVSNKIIANETNDLSLKFANISTDGKTIDFLNYGIQFNLSEYLVNNGQNLTKDIFYVSANKDKKIEFANATSGKVICEKVVKFDCFNDVFIDSDESVDKSRKMNCHKLHGSLFIRGLGKKSSGTHQLDFIQKLESIGGALVVSNVGSDVDIVFESLKEIGKHLMVDSLSSVQITSNRANNIKLPSIDLGGKKSVTISDEKKLSSNNSEHLNVTINSDSVGTFNSMEKIEPRVSVSLDKLNENGKVETEKDLKKKNFNFSVHKFIQEPIFDGIIVTLIQISPLLVVIGFIGSTAFLIHGSRKREKYDMALIVKNDDDNLKLGKDNTVNSDLGST
ncbi:Receptor L-domain domain-containing protein [Caenorhabditis elegans]|uniref:Receptor L-domain domain-containing protein n=1 Tax=Caenorhabditis elegans TaxID=6239 RepID=O44506_CAEEL|nr:Receptor L-domain domain-containing protein [Caenorhabditis elegans]CCD61412.1 Receptor L-domain domain-containing protein [Caenorhabditis elegans]|eukprot:NP_501355.3 Insulin/EGF-Receptor L Domain protein [Caenorhabditis elegans]